MKKTLVVISIALSLSACVGTSTKPTAVGKANAAVDMATSMDKLTGECLSLATALKGCQQGPAGPFGTIRMGCESIAEGQFTCEISTDTLKTMISL